MSSAQLTIITPTLNASSKIKACLEHVKQERTSDLQHIIVDGGSSDDTCQIVRDFALQNTYVQLVSDSGGNQSHSMNLGIKSANSAWIGFLNVDDCYQAGTLLSASALFKDLPVPSLLVGNCRIINTQGKLVGISRPRKLDIIEILAGGAYLPHPINPSQYFYHRSLHELVGYYDESLDLALDYEFLLRAIPHANCHYINQVWGNFFNQAGNKTTTGKQSGALKQEINLVRNKVINTLSVPQRLGYLVRRCLYFPARCVLLAQRLY